LAICYRDCAIELSIRLSAIGYRLLAIGRSGDRAIGLSGCLSDAIEARPITP
jgi:hypothetical protein